MINLKTLRKTASAFVLLLGLASCGSDYYLYTGFHEPATEGLRYLISEDGLTWDSLPGVWLKPEVGKQKVMRDPSIVRSPEGIYHLVWTSSWRGDRGFGYAWSKDLIHWSEQRFIETMTDTTTVNVWAPELFYDDTRDEYMIFWASCVPGKFDRGIEEEENNHRLYYTTTKDFRSFTPAQLLIEPGYSTIDAIILKRGEKDYVMVVKDNTRPERNLKVSFATDPHGPWSAPSAPFTEQFTEGPSVVKVDQDYYIYYDRYRSKDFGAMKTRDFKHFENAEKEIFIPKLHKHGTITTVPKHIVDQLRKRK
jgi:hypothetical protein